MARTTFLKVAVACLLGIVVTLVMLLGLERRLAARAFTTASVVYPYFFADANGLPTASNPYLTGFNSVNGEGPIGIAFVNGKIYVTDEADNTFYVFPSSGGGAQVVYQISGTPSPCSEPTGLILSSVNTLYVACYSVNLIYEISFTGVYIRTVNGANLSDIIVKPRDMVMAANGDLLVSGSLAVFRVTTGVVPAATTCATGGAINSPDGIVIDQQTSTLYVSNLGKIAGKSTVAKIPLDQFPSSGTGCGTASTFATFQGSFGVDGIAVGSPKTACADTLYVNANNGNLYTVPISTGVPDINPIATGSERGDLVKVSPDGYLFATQAASVAKLGPNCFVSSTPGCVPPPADMVAWWPLDEPAGSSTIVDIVGSHNGTPLPSGLVVSSGNGGPVTNAVNPPFKVVGSLDFPNSIVFARVPSSPALEPGPEHFIIDAWVYPVTTNPDDIQPIVDKWDRVNNKGYAFYIHSPGIANNARLAFRFGDGTVPGSPDPVDSIVTLPYMQWTHVAVTFRRTGAVPGPIQVLLYINGQQQGALSGGSIGAITNLENLLIGGTQLPLPAGFGEIALDEVEIFKLKPADTDPPVWPWPGNIATIYGAGSYGKCRAFPRSVGGITQLTVGGSDSAGPAATYENSGGLAEHYAAIAGGAAAAVMALALAGWYTRRRWRE